MTANSPLKSSPDDGEGPATVKDTKDYMKNLDEELSKFDAHVDSFKGSGSSASRSSASRSGRPQVEEPHFTIDSSPTRSIEETDVHRR